MYCYDSKLNFCVTDVLGNIQSVAVSESIVPTVSALNITCEFHVSF